MKRLIASILISYMTLSAGQAVAQAGPGVPTIALQPY